MTTITNDDVQTTKYLNLSYLSFFVAIGAFSIGVDAYIVAGLLPEISLALKVSLSSVGLLISSYMLCYGLLSPILSILAANFRVKTILTFSLLIFVSANLLSAFAPSFIYILISRVIAGIGAGLYMPVALTTIVSLAPEHKKGHYLGVVFGGMASGTITGVPIGLLLVIHFGWHIGFLFVSLLGVIALVMQFLSLPNIRIKAPPSIRERLAVFKNKNILFVITVSTLCAMGGLSIYSYLPLILKSIGTSQNAIVIDIFTWGIGGLFGSFMSGRILDLIKNPFLMSSITIAMILVSITIIPLIQNLHYVLLVALFLWGMAGWGLQVPQQFLIHKFAPNYGAIALSLALSMRYLGIAVGTAAVSLILSYGIQPKSLPFISGVVIAVALFTHLFFMRRGRSN